MLVAELGRISEHDRGLMAMRIVGIMGVAMMITMVVVIMMVMMITVMMVVRAVLVIAMYMRMVTSAMAMIECAHVKPKYPCL